MPPMKVTQRAAPHAVEKQSKWANFNRLTSFGECWFADSDSDFSGKKVTPIAKNVAAAKNLLIQPISSIFFSPIQYLKFRDQLKEIYSSWISWPVNGLKSYQHFECLPKLNNVEIKRTFQRVSKIFFPLFMNFTVIWYYFNLKDCFSANWLLLFSRCDAQRLLGPQFWLKIYFRILNWRKIYD